MILKTEDGLAQADKCPICGYWVTQDHMVYDNEKAVICSFCLSEWRKQTDFRSKYSLQIDWPITVEERVDREMENRCLYHAGDMVQITTQHMRNAFSRDRATARVVLLSRTDIERGGE